MEVTFLQVAKVVTLGLVAIAGIRLLAFGIVFAASKVYFALNPNAAEKWLANKKAEENLKPPVVLFRGRNDSSREALLR